jgi:DNA-binding MarR family transcriptional regulator
MGASVSEPPIDFNGLNTVVHGPIRLGVLTALHMDGAMDFTTLKKRLGVTDGVLGMHLEKLESLNYIAGTQAMIGRRPRTTYKITATGRKALSEYLTAMRRLLDSVSRSAH